MTREQIENRLFALKMIDHWTSEDSKEYESLRRELYDTPVVEEKKIQYAVEKHWIVKDFNETLKVFEDCNKAEKYMYTLPTSCEYVLYIIEVMG